MFYNSGRDLRRYFLLLHIGDSDRLSKVHTIIAQSTNLILKTNKYDSNVFNTTKNDDTDVDDDEVDISKIINPGKLLL